MRHAAGLIANASPLGPAERSPIVETGFASSAVLARSQFSKSRSLPGGVLHAGRAEQISAKVRMAYRPVADDIDERGLAGPQCTFEGRAKILWPLDVLTVTIHELEHPVVALVR
jgi:hypothetical protein